VAAMRRHPIFAIRRFSIVNRLLALRNSSIGAKNSIVV
jgi:hypothetical protein